MVILGLKERVIEVIHVRDCLKNVLSDSDLLHEDNRIRVLGFTDEISLKVINRDVENLGREMSKLRKGRK